MLNAFVCGSFHHEEEDEPCPSTSSPKKSKRSSKDHSRDNNPYSTRGLDKFSSLLADLDQKRQKVYSQMNPHDISFLRFRYSSTDDFVPIVVKVKNNKDKKKHNNTQTQEAELLKVPMENKSETGEVTVALEERKQPMLESDHKNKNKSFSNWNMLKHPSFYVPVVMILILMFLTLFGRSVATLCTCVMWYLIPTILNDDSSKLPRKSVKKKKKKKKDYVRGLSEKNMATSADSGASNDKTSGKHSHQKSW